MNCGIVAGEFMKTAAAIAAGGGAIVAMAMIGRGVLRGRPWVVMRVRRDEELKVTMETKFARGGGDFDSFEGGGDLVVGGRAFHCSQESKCLLFNVEMINENDGRCSMFMVEVVASHKSSLIGKSLQTPQNHCGSKRCSKLRLIFTFIFIYHL